MDNGTISMFEFTSPAGSPDKTTGLFEFVFGEEAGSTPVTPTQNAVMFGANF